jgi:hypothetical protein
MLTVGENNRITSRVHHNSINFFYEHVKKFSVQCTQHKTQIESLE